MRTVHEKANPPRGGGAKPRASHHKRQPGHRKEHHGVLWLCPPEYLGARATLARPDPDRPRGPTPQRRCRARRGTSGVFVRTVPRTAGGGRAGGDVGGWSSPVGLVRPDAPPFGVPAAATPERGRAGLRGAGP